MDNLQYRIHKHLFVLFDSLDKKIHPDAEEYIRVREERMIEMFGNSIKVEDYEIFPN